MKTPLLIGITGGIGSGKTAVSQLLRECGYLVYDADVEARRLQHDNEIVRQKTTELFGSEIYDTDGVLNRPLLAKTVFNDAAKLRRLTDIVHPALKIDFEKWVTKYSENRLLFMESAILFESGFYTFFDKTVVVAASEETRIERVMRRDNITRKQVLKRIVQQLPEKELLARADYIIRTDDSQLLKEKIEQLLNCIFC